MQSNAKQIYTIGFCVYQRNYLIINKAVISFRYAVFINIFYILQNMAMKGVIAYDI